MFALSRVLKKSLLLFFKGMRFLNPFKFKSALTFSYVIFFAASFISAADTPSPNQIQKMNFTNVNIEDGLSDNDIRDMYQDDLGFVWFATAHGLSRYDGRQSVNYNHSLILQFIISSIQNVSSYIHSVYNKL